MATCIDFVVDGKSYYVPEACIRKYPDSYFCAALNPHWHDQNDSKLYLNNRNSDLFQFIALYLQFGVLPRDKRGDCLIDRLLLPSLLEEADFFCLSPLVDEINELMVSDDPASNVGRLVVSSVCYSASTVSIGYDLSQVNNDWYNEQLGNVDVEDEDNDEDTDSNDEDDNETTTSSDSDPDLKKSRYDGIKIVDKTRFSAHCLLSSYWFQKAVHHKPRVIYNYAHYYGCTSFNLTIGTKSFHMMPLDMSPVKPFIRDSVNMFSNALIGHELVIYKDLVLAPSFHRIRLQRIHYDSSTESLCGQAQSEEDREVVGYVLVNVPSKESEIIGGNVILDTGEEYNLSRRDVIAFYKNVKYELKPVTKGSRLLLVFEIIREQSQTNVTEWYSCGNFYQKGAASRQPTSLALPRIHQYFVDYLSKYSMIGVYTTEDYVEKGFNVNNLIGYDKALYEYMIDRCPISLVYVVVTGHIEYDDDYQKYKSTVKLLNIKYDTRLQCHRGCGSIPFIGSRRVRKCHEIETCKMKFEDKNSKSWKFITTAFIIGVPK